MTDHIAIVNYYVYHLKWDYLVKRTLFRASLKHVAEQPKLTRSG